MRSLAQRQGMLTVRISTNVYKAVVLKFVVALSSLIPYHRQELVQSRT